MKKRLNLEELELSLPAIDEKNSKILLGGNDYDGGLDDSCRYCAQLTFGESDSNSRGGNSGNNRGGQDDHDYGEEGNDYGDNFDLDVSIDGYHDYDGGTDGDGGSSGSNGSTYVAGSFANNLPDTFKNGIDISNYLVSGGMALGDMNSRFIEQFYTILETNSTIAGHLQNLTDQGFNFNFNIAQIINNNPGEHTNAQTSLSGFTNTLNIQFNIDQMNPDDGWTNTSNDSDPMESLVETILHEVTHATYLATFEKAREDLLSNQVNATPLNVFNSLSASHGVDFAQMFIQYDPVSNMFVYINDEAQQNTLQHDYMNTHGVDQLFEDAKDEFVTDLASLVQRVSDLESMISQAAANLGTGVSPDGGQGPGPSNESLKQTYDNLVWELQDLLINYGWMLP